MFSSSSSATHVGHIIWPRSLPWDPNCPRNSWSRVTIWMPTIGRAVALLLLATNILPSDLTAMELGSWNPRPPKSAQNPTLVKYLRPNAVVVNVELPNVVFAQTVWYSWVETTSWSTATAASSNRAEPGQSAHDISPNFEA